MEREDLRRDVRTAFEELLGASPGLEDRVLATLPRSPARPGQRVVRESLRWPAAAIALALVAVVVIGSVTLRAAASHRTPATGGTPPGPYLTLGDFSGTGSGWVISQAASAGQDPNQTTTVSRTDDAGATWRAQLRISLVGPHLRASADGSRAVLWGIFYRHVPTPPATGGKVRPDLSHAYTESLQVYRTADAGAHWTAMPALPAAVMAAFSDPDHGLAVERPGPSLGLLSTGDGGASWTPVGMLPNAGNGVMVPSLTALDATTAWYATGTTRAGHSSLYATHDGGRTWAEVALPAPPGVAPGWTLLVDPPPTVFPDGTGLLLVSAGNYPARPVTRELFVYQTHDGGRTWGAPRPLFAPGSPQAGLQTRANTETGIDQSFQFLDATHWWVAVQVVSGGVPTGRTPSLNAVPTTPVLFTTADGGVTWAAHATAIQLKELRFVDARQGWAVEIAGGVPNRLILSTDGGASWIAVRLPPP
jgi:photosystem II stability/assembly factor-like uncharacterized protein